MGGGGGGGGGGGQDLRGIIPLTPKSNELLLNPLHRVIMNGNYNNNSNSNSNSNRNDSSNYLTRALTFTRAGVLLQGGGGESVNEKVNDNDNNNNDNNNSDNNNNNGNDNDGDRDRKGLMLSSTSTISTQRTTLDHNVPTQDSIKRDEEEDEEQRREDDVDDVVRRRSRSPSIATTLSPTSRIENVPPPPPNYHPISYVTPLIEEYKRNFSQTIGSPEPYRHSTDQQLKDYVTGNHLHLHGLEGVDNHNSISIREDGGIVTNLITEAMCNLPILETIMGVSLATTLVAELGRERWDDEDEDDNMSSSFDEVRGGGDTAWREAGDNNNNNNSNNSNNSNSEYDIHIDKDNKDKGSVYMETDLRREGGRRRHGSGSAGIRKPQPPSPLEYDDLVEQLGGGY